MDKTCGSLTWSSRGIFFKRLPAIALVASLCLAVLPAFSSTGNAREVDTIAKLIADSKKATADGEKAAAKSRKKPSKPERKTKNTRKGAAKKNRTTSAPPVPARNPVRGLKTRTGTARHRLTSAAMPPVPTRTGLISDRVQALAPLLHYRIPSNDMKALKRSIDHVLRNRLSEARSARSQISDPGVRKLAHWYYLRKALAVPDPLEMHRFARKNPDWPSGSLLRRRTERALLSIDVPAATVLKLYRKKPPRTGIGKFLLARAYKRLGKPKKALKLARAAWHTHALGQKTEKQLLEEFGNQLTKADHRRRADHFLYRDKKRLLPTVRRVKKHLPKAEEEKINLRMEVIKRRLNDAHKQYEKLGAKAYADVGLLFNKIQLSRRKENFDYSRKLLARAPVDAKKMVEPDEWWIERRLQTRYALRHNKPLEAYKIASRHGKISRKNLCEAEFLAGWIALTRLNRPEDAARHFAIQRKNAVSRAEIAKAEYWLGRLKLKQKDSVGALMHFANAARYFRTYYGQLALQSVESEGRLPPTQTPVPSKRDLRKFMARDAVRALIIAHKAQLRSLVPLFFNHLAWRLKSPGEMTLLAELASQIHSRRGSVITGKIGVYRGFALDRYAYPVNALPHFEHLTEKVDLALVLALARQESEFNARAKSPVGARGMMQIMPGTARAIARQHKVRYSKARLTSDPAYNTALGVAHLHDLIKKYNGSYILPLVAYNAGPGRVRDWIESFGDPRDPSVDTIDWIESIPFTETRRYVQRIMSSAQIFRARLKEGSKRIELVQDINRGVPKDTAGSERPPVVKVTYTPPR